MQRMLLKIYLLGQFRLVAGDQPLELRSRRAQSLLAYLAMTAGMTHRRERLAGLLWPEATDSNARSYLRQALWRIRKALDSALTTCDDYLLVNDVSMTFDASSSYWLDVDQLLGAGETESIEKLLVSVRLYRGELLPGFYDEWILPERDRILALYQQKMCLLLEQLLHAGRGLEAVRWSEQWLQLARAPEQAFRMVMRAYAGLDDRGMVKATYERCWDSLEREMALEPSLETEQLYEALRDGQAADFTAWSGSMDNRLVRHPSFLKDDASVPVEKPLFVAREIELERLDGFLRRVLDEQGQAAFVAGEVGSGKTALINEFTKRALAEHPLLIVVSGTCNVHTGIGDPYLPFREMLEMLTGDVEGRWAAASIDTNHARLLWRSRLAAAQAIARHGPDLVNTFVHGPALVERMRSGSAADEEWISRLHELAWRKADTGTLVSMQQSDLFEQYSKVLQNISRHLVLVLTIDDLQWADLGSISLLFHLGRQLAGQRILILGAYRPEEIALGRDGQRHPLEPVVNELQRVFGGNTVNLNQAQSSVFVNNLLDSEPNLLGPSFRHLITHQTRGNPLFTVELLRGMQERGDLSQNENGQWVEEPDLDWETLPARVEAVIAERIGRLDQPLRAVLRAASVEGESFTAEVVARVLGRDEQELLASLGSELDRKHRLVKAQTIVRRGDSFLSSYRFRHILFQRYLYNSLNEVERVHYHEQVGTALEDLYGGQEDGIPVAPQLARHFEEAQIGEKAIKYLHQAGMNAIQLSAYREGVTHLEKALVILNTFPKTLERDRRELSLQLSLALAYKGTEGSQSDCVREAWTRARDLSSQTGQSLQLCTILGELAIYHYVRAEYQDALQLGDQALVVATEAGDPLLVAMSHWHLGLASFARGEYVQAREHFDEVISFYDPQRHHQQLVSVRGSDIGLGALAYNACCLLVLGHAGQACERSEQALALARQFYHAFTLADVLCYGGCLFNKIRQEPGAQLDLVIELSQLVVRFSLDLWLGEANSLHGEALVRLGRVEEGIALLERGISDSESADSNLFLSIHYCSLAEAHAAVGRYEESWSALNQAFDHAEKRDERLWYTQLQQLKARLLLQDGREVEAVEALNRALEVARDQGAKTFELSTAIDLARLYEKQGKKEAARAILTPIYEWFAEGFDSPDICAARALLNGFNKGS
jgi:predicted ATPase/DNA-binding SARP family transcriptional activator